MLQLELRFGTDKFYVGDEVRLAETSDWHTYVGRSKATSGIIFRKYMGTSHKIRYIVEISNSRIECRDYDLVLIPPMEPKWEI